MSGKSHERPRSNRRHQKLDAIPGAGSPLSPALVRNGSGDSGVHPIRELLPHHLAQLADGSGLSEKVIKERGYYSASDPQELAKLGFGHAQRRTPCLVIPVSDVDGQLATWMIRPDSPRENKGKLLKYEFPKGSRVVLDVPRSVQPMLGDANRELWITEGSKKADSAVSHGLTCIALSGVWNWRGTNEDGGKTALPDWESVALDGRSVVIAFDSDVVTKPPVIAALTRFRDFLKSRGANVRICILPSGDNEAKMGLDDFFVGGGTVEELRKLVVDDLPAKSAILEQRDSYLVMADGVYMNAVTPTGEAIVVKIMNFDARIVLEVRRDDGAEEKLQFHIDVQVNGQTRSLAVSADDFREHVWIHAQVGSAAIVEVGQSWQRISHAIQTLSTPEHQTLYCHTGWRQIRGRWHFLHADGSVGPVGPVGPVEPTGVELPEAMQSYKLPVPPIGDERAQCVLASLSFVQVAPGHVTWPLLLAAYRAVLGDAGFSLFVLGFTGTRKSSTAAVLQQHFGKGFSLTNLPGNWSSTANATEEMLFAAKDVPYVLDDFVPPAGMDRGKHDASADRLLRNAANRAGRQRMRSDGSLRPNRPPRGLIIATGEVLPRGHSLLARVVIVEIGKGDVDLPQLTRLQGIGSDGTLARAMAGFIQWLSPQLELVQHHLRSSSNQYRAALSLPGAHGRTIDALSELMFTLDLFLRFATEVGAIDEGKAKQLRTEAHVGLLHAGAEQASQQIEEDIASSFMRQLRAAIASGRGHLADAKDGIAPPAHREVACGWRLPPGEVVSHPSRFSTWEPRGDLVGWIDEDDAYLLPDVSESIALRIARERGEPINVSGKALRKRLQEAGLLSSSGRNDGDGRLMIRKRIAGGRHEVLHLPAGSLLGDGPDPTDPVGPRADPDPTAGDIDTAPESPVAEIMRPPAPPPTAPPFGPAATPAAPPNAKPSLSPCWTCRGTVYQRATTGPWVCGTCHPVPVKILAEQLDIGAAGGGA